MTTQAQLSLRVGLSTEKWSALKIAPAENYSPLFTVTQFWVLTSFSLINSFESFQFFVKVEQSNHVWCCRQQELSSFLPGLSNITASYMPQFLFLFEIIFTIYRSFTGELPHWPGQKMKHVCKTNENELLDFICTILIQGHFIWRALHFSDGHFNFHMATNLIQIHIELESGQLQKPCLVIHNLDPFRSQGQSSLHRFLSVYTALDIQWKTPLKNIIIKGEQSGIKMSENIIFYEYF